MKIGIEAQRIFRKDKHGMDMVIIHQIRTLMKTAPEEYRFYIYTQGERDPAEWPDHPQFEWRNHEASYPVWEQIWLPRTASADGLDLLHCTSNTAPLFAKVPVAVTVHDIIYYDKNPLFAGGYTPYQRFGNMYRRWVVAPVMKKAKWVATVSGFECDRMEKRFPFLNGKIHTLYNAVSDGFVPATEKEKRSLRDRYNLHDPYFLFLGNTDPKKNTPGALRAFALALTDQPDLRMVVADLDESYVRRILGKDADRVMDRIVPVGYIPNTEMNIWMSASRFFLYPSLRESFGIPIIEGMASGTPVITSTTTSMPEVAGGAARLVDPLNIREIATAMTELWNNEEERYLYIERGLERAGHFSWEANVNHLLELYRHAV